MPVLSDRVEGDRGTRVRAGGHEVAREDGLADAGTVGVANLGRIGASHTGPKLSVWSMSSEFLLIVIPGTRPGQSTKCKDIVHQNG